MDDFPRHGISQIILVLEMMKERSLGRASLFHDPVDTPALKTVFVEFSKSSFEDSASRILRFRGRCHFHLAYIQTSRYVVNRLFMTRPIRRKVGRSNVTSLFSTECGERTGRKSPPSHAVDLSDLQSVHCGWEKERQPWSLDGFSMRQSKFVSTHRGLGCRMHGEI